MSTELFTGFLKDEPADQYHARKGYISSSPLPEMTKSPMHFHHAWTTESVSTDAMDKGEFIHKLLLEQDIEKYVARPLKEDGDLVRSNSKEYAAFLAQNQGKTPIHPDLYNEALAILSAACTSEPFLRAFEQSDIESSFYAKHADTGLYLKARPDMIAKDRSFILDVKSTADIQKFEKQIFNLGYDVRLIHYCETIRALEGVMPKEIYFMAIESSAPYGRRMYRLTPAAIEAASIQWHSWITEIGACAQDNVWPGLSDEISDVDRPKWLAIEQSISFDGVG